MAYTILASILGAIVSAAIALFGFQTWAALKVAPVVGALAGLLVAILSLRRYGLPLTTTLEDYRSAAGVSGGIPKLFFNQALLIGLIIALIELPCIMLGQSLALTVFIAGCPVILGGTFYRCWLVRGGPIRLDVFQITGGVCILFVFGWIACVFVPAITTLNRTIPLFELTRTMLAFNAVVAICSAVLTCFAFALAASVGARTD